MDTAIQNHLKQLEGPMFRFMAALILCLATVTANAALLGRAALTPGGTDYQAYYDDVLGITWLADADYAKTSGYDSDGLMTWAQATGWIAALNTANHLGTNAWRLPTLSPVNGSYFSWSQLTLVTGGGDFGWNISAPGSVYPGSTASEFSHLFYTTLGNTGNFAVDAAWPNDEDPCGNGGVNYPNYCLDFAGPFLNVKARPYWTSIENPTDDCCVWEFRFDYGRQDFANKEDLIHAWAVTDGDAFAVVPVPAAAWLFGSALGLMGWMRRLDR